MPPTIMSRFWRRLFGRHREPDSTEVLFDQSVLVGAEVAASAALPKETGGILVGYRTASAVIIERCIEIADTRASSVAYRRSHAAAERALQTALADSNTLPRTGYVGEWHSHPLPCGPSDQDVRELLRISQQSPHAVALLVLTPNGPGAWAATSWVAQRGRLHAARNGSSLNR